MNKTYRSVWSDALGAWVAVSELAPSRGKRSGSVVASVALLLFAGAPAWAQTITSSGDVTSSFAQTASPWNAGGSLDIGNAAAGGLALAGGAQVSSTQLHLGNSVGVAGALTVDGAGSTLNVAGQFDVGAVGTGTLSITNGGTVVNTGKAGIYYYFGVGYGSGTGNGSATGNVTISGTGSKLSTQYSSYIGGTDSAGGTGSGTVTVSHGGTFTTPTSFIGFDVFGNGGSGTVNVTDAGSSWVNTGVSRIGYGSGATEHGTVNVGNGATATIGNFAIVGLGTGGAGIVNVSGNGSTWNVANTANTNGVGLAIGLGANTGTGANATGAVTIADGAVVNTPVVRLGTDAGASASGTLNIGAAAGLAAAAPGTLNAPTVVFNWLSPGNSNGSPTTGTLNFNHTSTDGSYVFAPNIGSGGGTGSATINQLAGHTTLTGNSGGYGGFTQVSGGVLGVTGTLGNGTGDVAVSQGAFNVEGGGTVNARTATYGDTVGGIATGSVSGAGSSLNVAGQFDVGAVGTGTLSITNGGTVVNTGSTGGGAFFGVGHGSGTGNVTISGAGSALSNLSASYIGGTDSAGGTGSGTVTVSHGGTFTTPTSFIGFDVFGNGGSGTVNVTDAGSSWVNTGVSRIGYGSGATEHGTVNVGNGATATIGNFAIVGLGTGGAGIVNVSGNGSTWNVANTANTNGVGLAIGLGANTGTGANATGAVTIADGAVVNTPVVRLGTDAGASASGTLNIGAAAGLAAAAPGTLNAPTVVFNWLSPGNSNGSPTTGTLNFNHTSTDGSYVFAPNIGSGGGTGSATINQLAGHTTLTGNSGGYGGTTNVTGGTLRVNGTLGNATSQVNVGNGAALGGAGTIGGNVAIGDGVLSPGNSPGTLTINGNLALSSASTLNYELGAANTVGGPLNDLTVVNGNLTLDGTLNVTQSAGGTYGAGVYRLIDYAGTLTDNGLALGSMPAGTDNYVQTSIAKQVNLVNSRGLTLNWWDGSAGGRNDGAIAGGNGTWTAIGSGATADRWTQADGQINAPYQNGSFAIFAGGPGTVTVDNSAGQVRVSGMQFATSGYRIEGGPVELAAGTNAIRVGDGTSAGAAATATIASALTGAGKLDKVDLGTLVLTGANTYTGGTTVSGGTL
ncbi:MAG: ESPR-type extended signal peptide-containing protein, partial [Pseudomonadota bacterium]|nr:ESPR-type extended signal peptide-containing protein [Pseudomonadota bacterium]